MQANDKQIGGTHYKCYGDVQPWDVVAKWNLGYLEGTALKYIARWKDKGGIDDIKKAIHFLEKLVETETPNGTIHNQKPQLATAGQSSVMGYTYTYPIIQGQGWMEKLDEQRRPAAIPQSESVRFHSVRSGIDSNRSGDVPNSNDAIPHWGLTKEGDPHT